MRLPRIIAVPCIAPLIAMMASAAAAGQASGPDFSKSYQIWSQGNDGRCGYVVGDVYVNASQLRRALEADVHKEYGVEFLTSPQTPPRCVENVRRASKLAGFTLFRARPLTKQDENAAVPPPE
jgi:hypothetical protein